MPITKELDRELIERALPQAVIDDQNRALLRTLITFVATSKASHDAKNDALDAIQKLQARLLP